MESSEISLKDNAESRLDSQTSSSSTSQQNAISPKQKKQKQKQKKQAVEGNSIPSSVKSSMKLLPKEKLELDKSQSSNNIFNGQSTGKPPNKKSSPVSSSSGHQTSEKLKPQKDMLQTESKVVHNEKQKEPNSTLETDNSKEIKVQRNGVLLEKDSEKCTPATGALKTSWDNLSREMQNRMDENKIYFLKKKNSRFPNAKYFCRLCEYHMDNVEICEKHMADDKHLNRKEVGSMDFVLRRLPPPTAEHLDALSQAIDKVYDKYGIKESDRETRRAVVQKLEQLIHTKMPDVQLNMYGTSLSRMGLNTADINVNLSSTNVKKKLTTLMKDTYEFLKDRTDSGFVNVHSDFSATVPALLMTDEKTGNKLTVTIHFYAALCTSELLSIYADFDERTIKLAVAFRYWAHLCGVDKIQTGFVPAIALNLMVVYFLQIIKPQLLPIVSLPNIVGEEIGDFSRDKPIFQLKRNRTMKVKPELTNNMSVGELWLELMKFYSIELDIPGVVVTIRNTVPILRKMKPWNNRKLAVEEPFMNKNVSKMANRCYEFWQYAIKRSYHYFGRPRGIDGKDFSLRFPFPEEEEEEEEGKAKKQVDKPVASAEKETDLSLGVEQLKFGASTDSPTGSEASDKISSRDGDCLTADSTTPIASGKESSQNETCLTPSTIDSSINEISPIPETNSTKPCTVYSFILDYVNDIVDRSLYLATEAETTNESIAGFSPNSCHNEEKKTSKPENLEENGNIYNFEFCKNNFISRESVLVCMMCEQEGHHKNECPQHILPEILPIRGFTDLHHKILNETLGKILYDVGLTEASFRQRLMFLKALEEFIQVEFNGARLQLFGSSCNGFGFDRSDLDICMTFAKKRPNLNKVYAVERLARKLAVHKDLCDVQAISSAKVPIVKFHIRSIGLDADISLYNVLAQENTRMLNTYCTIDPRVKILCCTVKMFAQVCDIGDASRGCLSSYAFTLMMLHYLQQVQPPVIPVLQETYEGQIRPTYMVEGWDAWFMDELIKLPKLWPEMGQNKMSVAKLWLGFLRYYVEEFNHKLYVVCVRQKELLSRFEKLWNGSCLAIEDPFDLSHNLGSGLTLTMNTFILKTLINGRMLYGSPIDDNMELFKTYQSPSDYFFDTELLSEARPPNSRGCRHCGKIGHMIRHCPQKREQEDAEHGKEHKKRQERPDNLQRQQNLGRDGPKSPGHNSYIHPSHTSSPIQQNKGKYSFQQQKQHEAVQIQRQIERDLFGVRQNRPPPQNPNMSFFHSQTYHNKNMYHQPVNPQFNRPLAQSFHNQSNHMQFPPSLRPPPPRGLMNMMYPQAANNRDPRQFLVPRMNLTNNSNNMMRNNVPGMLQQSYRPVSVSANHVPIPLLPLHNTQQAGAEGLNPVVQNLFASTQGKVLDARFLSQQMKRN